jgi:hypothetical protein
MSNIEPRRPDGLAPLHDPKSQANPLALMIPAEWRPAVGRLWMCNAHLFGGSALALCATLRVYLDEHAITTEDVEGIVRILLLPRKRAQQRFASDVIAELSRLVAEAIEARKSRDQNQRLRAESAAFVSTRVLGRDFGSPDSQP